MTTASLASSGDEAATPGPLAGLTVVELHAIGPVPFAGQVLRALGARVIRVSPPNDPGLGVVLPPRYDFLNDGKETLALDLKQPADKARLAAMLEITDVLLEGFRPGVLERLGFAPVDLLDHTPRLVIGRLSGWGDAGPLAPRAGHDINYLALSGALSAIGHADTPVPPLNLVADFGGGAMSLLVGVLARLVRRSIDGRGGEVTTSILAGTVCLTPMFYGMIAGGVWSLQRASNLLDGSVPFYRVYRCADDRFVAVGALEPKFYAELLSVIGMSDLLHAADQYDSTTWPRTIRLLATRFAERDRDAWAETCAGRDTCLAPVLDFAEAAKNTHNQANGLYEVDGTRPHLPGIWRFS